MSILFIRYIFVREVQERKFVYRLKRVDDEVVDNELMIYVGTRRD